MEDCVVGVAEFRSDVLNPGVEKGELVVKREGSCF